MTMPFRRHKDLNNTLLLSVRQTSGNDNAIQTAQRSELQTPDADAMELCDDNAIQTAQRSEQCSPEAVKVDSADDNAIQTAQRSERG